MAPAVVPQMYLPIIQPFLNSFKSYMWRFSPAIMEYMDENWQLGPKSYKESIHGFLGTITTRDDSHVFGVIKQWSQVHRRPDLLHDGGHPKPHRGQHHIQRCPVPLWDVPTSDTPNGLLTLPEDKYYNGVLVNTVCMANAYQDKAHPDLWINYPGSIRVYRGPLKESPSRHEDNLAERKRAHIPLHNCTSSLVPEVLCDAAQHSHSHGMERYINRCCE